MKKIYSVMMLAMLLLVSACSSDEKEVLSMIPNDASAVISINVKSLALKADIKVKDGKLILPEYMSSLSSKIKFDDTKLINSGADYLSKIYVYAGSKDISYATIVKLSDAEAMRKYLTETGSLELTKNGDNYSCIMSRDFVILSDKYLLMGTYTHGSSSTDEQKLKLVTDLFNGTNPDNIATNSAAMKALGKDEDVTAYIQSAPIASLIKLSQYKNEMAGKMLEYMTKNFNGLALSLDFGKKSIDIKSEIIPADGSKALETWSKVIGKQSPDGLKFIPKGMYTICNLAINGEELVKIPEVLSALEMPVLKDLSAQDIKDIVAGIDGDITYGIDGKSILGGGNMKIYGAVKSKKSNDIIAKIESIAKAKGCPVTRDGYNISLKMGDFPILVGSKDGFIYFRTDDAPVTETAYDDTLIKDVIGDAPAASFIDLRSGSSMALMAKQFGSIDLDCYIESSADKNGKGECKFVFNNISTANSLQAILALLASAAS